MGDVQNIWRAPGGEETVFDYNPSPTYFWVDMGQIVLLVFHPLANLFWCHRGALEEELGSLWLLGDLEADAFEPLVRFNHSLHYLDAMGGFGAFWSKTQVVLAVYVLHAFEKFR